MHSQKLLAAIASNQPAVSDFQAFGPADSLSDDAVRSRAALLAPKSVPIAPLSPPPLLRPWSAAPLIPPLKPPSPTQQSDSLSWGVADRRKLGSYDARFHSASRCARASINIPFSRRPQHHQVAACSGVLVWSARAMHAVGETMGIQTQAV